MRACREAAVRRCRELAQGKYTGKKYELSSNLHIKDNKGDKSRDKQQAVAFVEAASNDCNSTVLGIDCIICDHLWYSDVAPASQAYEYWYERKPECWGVREDSEIENKNALAFFADYKAVMILDPTLNAAAR